MRTTTRHPVGWIVCGERRCFHAWVVARLSPFGCRALGRAGEGPNQDDELNGKPEMAHSLPDLRGEPGTSPYSRGAGGRWMVICLPTRKWKWKTLA